jgi:hypothetical protein
MSEENLIQRIEAIIDGLEQRIMARVGERIDASIDGLEQRIMERVDERIDGLEQRIVERVGGRIDASEDRMKTHVTHEREKVETKLLAEFHWWARPVEMRVRDTGSIVHGFEERLVLLEEHMLDIERRLGKRPS